MENQLSLFELDNYNSPTNSWEASNLATAKLLSEFDHPFIFLKKINYRHIGAMIRLINHYNLINGIARDPGIIIASIRDRWNDKGDTIIYNAEKGIGHMVELKSTQSWSLNQVRPFQNLPTIVTKNCRTYYDHYVVSMRDIQELVLKKPRGQHTKCLEAIGVGNSDLQYLISRGQRILSMEQLFEFIDQDVKSNFGWCYTNATYADKVQTKANDDITKFIEARLNE